MRNTRTHYLNSEPEGYTFKLLKTNEINRKTFRKGNLSSDNDKMVAIVEIQIVAHKHLVKVCRWEILSPNWRGLSF